MALSIKAIEAIKPTDRRQELPDRNGLYLIIQPKPSGARSWAYRYRPPSDPGKVRKMTLGDAEAISLAEAREQAEDARRSVKKGIDPAEVAKVAKAKARDRSNVVNDLLDTYLTKYEAEHKASSAAEVRRLFAKWVRPAIGSKRVEDVNPRDVSGILAAMAKAGAPISANRLLAALKPFFSWIKIGGDPLPALPTAGIVKPVSEEGRDRDRVLSDNEIRWLWKATDDDTPFSAAVRLMLLTGQRRGEVSGMVTGELELKGDNPAWLLPAARTKNGRENFVPLSPAAVASIKRPPHIGRGKLVLTSATGSELSGWSKCKNALDARILSIATIETGRPPNIEPWVLHDLRRTAATGMARLGVPVHVIEAVLNHKTGAISRIAGIYNRWSYADEKRAALESWSAHIQATVFL